MADQDERSGRGAEAGADATAESPPVARQGPDAAIAADPGAVPAGTRPNDRRHRVAAAQRLDGRSDRAAVAAGTRRNDQLGRGAAAAERRDGRSDRAAAAAEIHRTAPAAARAAVHRIDRPGAVADDRRHRDRAADPGHGIPRAARRDDPAIRAETRAVAPAHRGGTPAACWAGVRRLAEVQADDAHPAGRSQVLQPGAAAAVDAPAHQDAVRRRSPRAHRLSSHAPTARRAQGAVPVRRDDRRGRADERNHRRPSCLLYPA